MTEIVVLGLIYLFTMLIPISWFYLMAIRREHKKNKHILMGLWKMQGRIGSNSSGRRR